MKTPEEIAQLQIMNHMLDDSMGNAPWSGEPEEYQPETKDCQSCGSEVAISEAEIFSEEQTETILCSGCVVDIKKKGFDDSHFKPLL